MDSKLLIECLNFILPSLTDLLILFPCHWHHVTMFQFKFNSIISRSWLRDTDSQNGDALLYIYYNNNNNNNNNSIHILISLLDFSSTFDTNDNSTLNHQLHTDMRFTDTVLKWFSYHLTDRKHHVCQVIIPTQHLLAHTFLWLQFLTILLLSYILHLLYYY